MSKEYIKFRKKLQFLTKSVKQIDELYNNLLRSKRNYLLDELEDMTCESSKELWNLLHAVRELELSIELDWNRLKNSDDF